MVLQQYAVLCLALYLPACKQANEKSHEREVSGLPLTYRDGEPDPVEGLPQEGQELPCEVDSKEALPHEGESRYIFTGCQARSSKVNHDDVHGI